MAESPHYRDLLRALSESGVEYLVVGGHAVMKYSEPRFTKDLDIWVRNSSDNSVRLYEALLRFGAPVESDGLTSETFTRVDVVYQIGVAPVRIDISTHCDGLTFDDCWPHRVSSVLFGEPVNFISLEDLITNKRATGRRADREDVQRLRRARKKGER